MITQKANSKIFQLIATMKKDKTQELACMIAANNILITDITKKGELVFEYQEPTKVALSPEY